jgi:hypothetical protein
VPAGAPLLGVAGRTLPMCTLAAEAASSMFAVAKAIIMGACLAVAPCSIISSLISSSLCSLKAAAMRATALERSS